MNKLNNETLRDQFVIAKGINDQMATKFGLSAINLWMNIEATCGAIEVKLNCWICIAR